MQKNGSYMFLKVYTLFTDYRYLKMDKFWLKLHFVHNVFLSFYCICFSCIIVPVHFGILC